MRDDEPKPGEMLDRGRAMRHKTRMRLSSCHVAALVAGLAAATLAAAPAGALVAGAPATPPLDLKAADAAGPVSTAALGARCIGPAHDDTPAFQAAIDTGHTVYAPALGGQCHITRPLVMKTPGQIFYGDGRARTKIEVQPGFSGEGVFVAKTGEPGPVWRDFSVSFVQPDTDDRAKLTRYPPAFFARDTPRFQIEHLGCYVATDCVDMKGNSGGAAIADLQFSAFEVGIDIDGSLDTVRVIDPHWWPFSLSRRQQTVFFDQGPKKAIAMDLGRVDNLILRGGIFLGGLAMQARPSKGGAPNVNIGETDFDSYSALIIEDGSFQISGSDFSLGTPAAIAIDQSGGSLVIASSFFFVGSPLKGGTMIAMRGGSLTINGSRFTSLGFDVSALRQNGTSSLILTGNRFEREPNQAFKRPTIELQGGRTIANGNYATDKGSGDGAFMHIANDNPFNKIMGNTSPGWSPYSPPSRQGTYLFN